VTEPKLTRAGRLEDRRWPRRSVRARRKERESSTQVTVNQQLGACERSVCRDGRISCRGALRRRIVCGVMVRIATHEDVLEVAASGPRLPEPTDRPPTDSRRRPGHKSTSSMGAGQFKCRLSAISGRPGAGIVPQALRRRRSAAAGNRRRRSKGAAQHGGLSELLESQHRRKGPYQAEATPEPRDRCRAARARDMDGCSSGVVPAEQPDLRRRQRGLSGLGE